MENKFITYKGKCPRCRKEYEAKVSIKPLLIPGPWIKGACNCAVPVSEVVLTYQG